MAPPKIHDTMSLSDDELLEEFKQTVQTIATAVSVHSVQPPLANLHGQWNERMQEFERRMQEVVNELNQRWSQRVSAFEEEMRGMTEEFRQRWYERLASFEENADKVTSELQRILGEFQQYFETRAIPTAQEVEALWQEKMQVFWQQTEQMSQQLQQAADNAVLQVRECQEQTAQLYSQGKEQLQTFDKGLAEIQRKNQERLRILTEQSEHLSNTVAQIDKWRNNHQAGVDGVLENIRVTVDDACQATQTVERALDGVQKALKNSDEQRVTEVANLRKELANELEKAEGRLDSHIRHTQQQIAELATEITDQIAKVKWATDDQLRQLATETQRRLDDLEQNVAGAVQTHRQDNQNWFGRVRNLAITAVVIALLNLAALGVAMYRLFTAPMVDSSAVGRSATVAPIVDQIKLPTDSPKSVPNPNVPVKKQ